MTADHQVNMNCPFCGKQNPVNSSTCDFCGAWIEDADMGNSSQNISPATAASPEGSIPSEGVEPDESALHDESLPEINVQRTVQKSKKGIDQWIWWLVGCFVLTCLSVSCVALTWGFYSYSTAFDFLKPATATPPPVPTPEMLFFDDFSDPNSGWPEYRDEHYVDEYLNGAYHMVEYDINTTSWAYPDEFSVNDVMVEVDATKNAGPDENDMGLICRYRNEDQFYSGIITSDGYFGITKMTPDDFIVIGGEYLEYSDLINQGSATNHIQFDCVGDVLTLYVNGYQLDQQLDAEYSYGTVGLIIGTYSSPGTDILYDNFSVLQP
jgi:hypothetical protein